MSKPVWIGKSVARKEDDRLLHGLGQFAGDLEAAGPLHMAVLKLTSSGEFPLLPESPPSTTASR